MNVPIIENWSRINGKILNIHDSPDLSDFNEVEMHVLQVEPVNDFPNLLSEAEGTDLIVHFPTDLVQQKGLASGCRVSCWVRRAGLSRCFVHREHVHRIETGAASGKNNLM